MATYRNEAERLADQQYQNVRTQQNQEGSWGAQDPANAGMPVVEQTSTGGVTPPPSSQPGAIGQTPPVGTAPPWMSGQNNVATNTGQAWEGGPGVTMARPDYEGLPDIDMDYAAASRDAADQAYAAASQYFDEDFTRDNSALEAQLMNQGFARGSEGFEAAMSRMRRGQDAARAQAALQAQQIGHSQAGDLFGRSLAARGTLSGERERDADRMYGQSAGIANLALGARGQSMGRDTSMAGIAASSAASNNASNVQRYGIDTSRDLTLRRYGMEGDMMDWNQLMQAINLSRGGVNVPNFGGPGQIDVLGANQLVSGNRNLREGRDAQDRAGMAGLGAAVLGGMDWNAIYRSIFGG